jgi:hypothetical protein
MSQLQNRVDEYIGLINHVIHLHDFVIDSSTSPPFSQLVQIVQVIV